MIHIVWSGKGYLVAVFAFGSSLIANLLTNAVTGSGAYWDRHKWPLGLALLASAVPCWFVGWALRDQKSQILIDPKTYKEVVIRKSHTLFFIPMLWWGPILTLSGMVLLGLEFLR